MRKRSMRSNAGNLTKKTVDENDAVYTEILTDGLAGSKIPERHGEGVFTR